MDMFRVNYNALQLQLYYNNCQFLVPFIIEIDTRPDKGFIPTQEQLDWWRNISTLAGVPSNRRGSHRRAEGSVKIRREYRNLTKYNCLLIMFYIYICIKQRLYILFLFIIDRTERRRFHDALLNMKLSMVGNVSQYDLFVHFHHPDWAPGAYRGAAFLPWNREFLFRYTTSTPILSPKFIFTVLYTYISVLPH